jgi:exopolysaccharide production protein ExoY
LNSDKVLQSETKNPMPTQTTTLPPSASCLVEMPANEGVLPRILTPEWQVRLRRLWLHLVVKRTLDIAVSLAALILLSPLFLFIAVAILLDSGRPVLFWQERMGWRGKRFRMAKFRSMRTKADPKLEAMQREAAETGTLLKLQNDPRVTRFGRFLRSTSLDELPQLINILKGEMSLVGPRPLIPFMLQPYPEFAEARALLRPGITGVWQVRDREANTSAVGMMPYDLEYIREFSLWLDLRLLLETPLAVVKRTGAF